MPKVVFTFEGIRIEMQCMKEDKMRDICMKLGNKINKDINNLIFLYDGNIINTELKYKDIINSMSDEMNILVYEKEKEGIICPKCGECINIDNNNINNKIRDNLIGIKDQIEIINNSNNITINKIKSQLQNIIIVIDNMLKQIQNNDMNNKKNIDNIITGIIDIQLNDINKDIILYKSIEEIDVYINNEKINLITKDNNKKIYKFNKEGKYNIKYQFKNTITNLKGFFSECNEIIYLDLSNFNTSKVTDMSFMFNECKKLKDLNIINFNIRDNCNIKNMIKNIDNDCIKANAKIFHKIFK